MCQGWLSVCVCRPECECVCVVCYVLLIYHPLAINWLFSFLPVVQYVFTWLCKSKQLSGLALGDFSLLLNTYCFQVGCSFPSCHGVLLGTQHWSWLFTWCTVPLFVVAGRLNSSCFWSLCSSVCLTWNRLFLSEGGILIQYIVLWGSSELVIFCTCISCPFWKSKKWFCVHTIKCTYAQSTYCIDPPLFWHYWSQSESGLKILRRSLSSDGDQWLNQDFQAWFGFLFFNLFLCVFLFFFFFKLSLTPLSLGFSP